MNSMTRRTLHRHRCECASKCKRKAKLPSSRGPTQGEVEWFAGLVNNKHYKGEMMNEHGHYLRKYGCRVRLDGNTLIEMPVSHWAQVPPTSADEWYEVTAPQEQGYLDAVNKALGTDYALTDFAGR